MRFLYHIFQSLRNFLYYTTVTVRPNHNLRYAIGTDFCLEDTDTFQHDIDVYVHCPLANDPLPPPQFNMTATRIANDGTRHLLSGETADLVLNRATLAILLENDTVAVNITCRVDNSFGMDEMTTSIRVCGESVCI